MARGICGYGRYPDGHVGCPRAQSDMTPCVARDGHIALADSQVCVGCGAEPATLLTELRDAGVAVDNFDHLTTAPKKVSAANYLTALVARETEGLVGT